MRYLKYVVLLGILMVPLAFSQAQVSVGVGIGVGPGYVAGPPVCDNGYYPDYPYACAPYGYYGPTYFVDGLFIGAGPWYHWGHPAWFWNRGWDHDGWGRGRGWYGREGWNRGWGDQRGWEHDRGYGRGYTGGSHWHAENGFRGGSGGGGFHGGGGHGGGGFHGGRR